VGECEAVSIDLGDRRVSGLQLSPAGPRAAFVFAHGAGAGMAHPFMESVALGLADRGVATLRFQFPYMEEGGRRPDPPRVAQAAVRGAVLHAALAWPGLPLVAGGKSFGGRMSSHAQAADALPRVAGLAFLGFPLHAAGKPSDARGQHLRDVGVPMLFLQGTRDALADVELIGPLVARLGSRARLHWVEGADHSFRVPRRSGRSPEEIMDELLDAFSAWLDALG